MIVADVLPMTSSVTTLIIVEITVMNQTVYSKVSVALSSSNPGDDLP